MHFKRMDINSVILTYMNEIITKHQLRTIILEFDENKEAPEFESQALQTYYEMHDRTWDCTERLRVEREKVPSLVFRLEQVEEQYEQAKGKLEHLLLMAPHNTERPRVTMQLKMFTEELDRLLCYFVPDLIDRAGDFYEYDTFTIEEDTWLSEVAFKQFNLIFDDYENCKVNMVSFDTDLEDFKGVLGQIRKREGKYYDTMNDLIDRYTDLNELIDALYERVNEYDDTLLEFKGRIIEKSADE